MIIDWDLVGRIQATIFLFNSWICNFLVKFVYDQNFIKIAQAVIHRRRAVKNYDFEYPQNHSKSCTFRRFGHIKRSLFIKQKSSNFNSKTLLQIKKALNIAPKLSIRTLMKRKPILMEKWEFQWKFMSNLLFYLHCWTIRIPTRRSRPIIFLMNNLVREEICCISPWWKKKLVVVQKNDFENIRSTANIFWRFSPSRNWKRKKTYALTAQCKPRDRNFLKTRKTCNHLKDPKNFGQQMERRRYNNP